MTLDIIGLNRGLDAIYPTSTNLGYVLLISDTLTLNQSFTGNTSTDVITFSSAHNLVTKCRLRIVSTGSYPVYSLGTITPTTDYYFQKIDATTGYLCSDAAATTTLDFSSAGSGTLTANEQVLTVNDAKEAIINREVVHSNYNRALLSFGAGATNGEKLFNYSQAVSGGGANLTYKHRLVLLGATSTKGNTTGTKDHLFTLTDSKIIAAGQTNFISLLFKFSN